MNFFASPFSVPIAALFVAAVAIITRSASATSSRRMKAEQRMAMIARGMSAEDISLLLNTPDERVSGHDPQLRMQATRRVGIILCSVGLGAIIFFTLLVHIENDRDIYSGAAASLVPLAIGIGFLIDFVLQKRDLAKSSGGYPPAA